ncbi:hypothetical protein M5D96_011323 [Drosophila gunungcola]|uniref:Uncharacterized protein n=1 Tax=Drosophila gunungcola TaxID=103775 RepID=A0A9P9YFA2_9MUSC|nr:hypothetical protein M5D96_011323 [Drosophila gunungcola]
MTNALDLEQAASASSADYRGEGWSAVGLIRGTFSAVAVRVFLPPKPKPQPPTPNRQPFDLCRWQKHAASTALPTNGTSAMGFRGSGLGLGHSNTRIPNPIQLRRNAERSRKKPALSGKQVRIVGI